MINIIIFSKKNPSIIFHYFNYCKRFDFNFKLITSNEDLLKEYVLFKPSLFIVECFDENLHDLKFIKKLVKNLPIIAITTTTDEYICIKSFKLGIVNFLRVPCSPIELYYHLITTLKLLNIYNPLNHKTFITIGDFKLNLTTNQLIKNNEFIPLTNIEYKLLLLLVNNLNKVVSNEKIYKCLWSSSLLKDTSRTLQMHISHLRKKLELNPFTSINLVTIHKKGYSLIEKNKDSI